MKVVLFEIQARNRKKCVNKDLAGGMGTGTWIGNSWRARIFEYVKKKSVVLPEITSAYLAAIFKKAGWEVERVEVGRGLEIKTVTADLALVPSSIVDCFHEREAARILKNRGLKVGIYGTFASAFPDFFINDADFVIKGEAEAAAIKIVNQKELPGGIFEAGRVENLDSLPFPDWSLFPLNKYSYSPVLNKKPVTVMLASRGCPHTCSYYCAYPLLAGSRLRLRSVDNVVEEIKHLKKKYGVKAIDFRDALFICGKQRTRELAERLIADNLKIIWSCETRLDQIDKELLNIMHRAGLRNINVGIESSDPEILKKSRRLPVLNSYQDEIVAHCHKLGITVAAFFLIGLEDDTKESILETIKYAKKLNTLVAQFAIVTPYPGTGFFEKLEKEKLIIDHNWEDYDEYTPVFKHKNLKTKELLKLKERAFVSYYFRPAYLARHMPKYIFEKFLWPF